MTNDFYCVVGKNLRLLRLCHHLTQEEMARILCFSRSAYCQWELGNRSISAENLYACARYFNVDVSLFFCDSGKNPFSVRNASSSGSPACSASGFPMFRKG